MSDGRALSARSRVAPARSGRSSSSACSADAPSRASGAVGLGSLAPTAAGVARGGCGAEGEAALAELGRAVVGWGGEAFAAPGGGGGGDGGDAITCGFGGGGGSARAKLGGEEPGACVRDG